MRKRKETRYISCQTLLLTHQPLIAAGVFLRLPVVSFLHHCILTVRPRTTPPLGWLRGRGGSMPAVVRGKRLRRFVLLLPRRAGFHLLPCDTTESRRYARRATARSRCFNCSLLGVQANSSKLQTAPRFLTPRRLILLRLSSLVCRKVIKPSDTTALDPLPKIILAEWQNPTVAKCSTVSGPWTQRLWQRKQKIPVQLSILRTCLGAVRHA